MYSEQYMILDRLLGFDETALCRMTQNCATPMNLCPVHRPVIWQVFVGVNAGVLFTSVHVNASVRRPSRCLIEIRLDIALDYIDAHRNFSFFILYVTYNFTLHFLRLKSTVFATKKYRAKFQRYYNVTSHTLDIT